MTGFRTQQWNPRFDRCEAEGREPSDMLCLDQCSLHIRHFPPFFFTSTGLASHSGWNTSLMNPAAISLWISSPMALRFSSSNWRRGCFTGRAPARIQLGYPVSARRHPSVCQACTRDSTQRLRRSRGESRRALLPIWGRARSRFELSCWHRCWG